MRRDNNIFRSYNYEHFKNIFFSLTTGLITKQIRLIPRGVQLRRRGGGGQEKLN